MTATQPAAASTQLEDAGPRWREQVRTAHAIALFLDFDGTLAPIVPKPEMAAIDPRCKRLVERLKGMNGIQVAIVSGRQITDVEAKAGIEGIIYAGNHGLEIETQTVCFREPRAENARLELRRLALRLEQLFSDTTGIEIEPKGLSVAVHYRQVHESLHEWVKQSVRDTICRSSAFDCVSGKMVVDIRPAIDWNKGHAVQWLLKNFAPPGALPVYVGDDTTDEDAFRVLAGDALTIKVGQSGATAARFWISDVPAVRRFLAALFELRSADTSLKHRTAK